MLSLVLFCLLLVIPQVIYWSLPPRPLSSTAGVVDGGFHSGAFLCPSGLHLEVGLFTGSLLSTTFVSFLKAQVLGVGEVNGIGLTPAG